MPGPILRARWSFLKAIHPLFLLARSFPTIEDANQCYSPTDVDVDNLQNEITDLRKKFNANTLKQLMVGIGQLTEDHPTLDGLELDLQMLLEELEPLVDPQVLGLEEIERTFESESLARFPKLVALRKLLKDQESPASSDIPDVFFPTDNPDTPTLTETELSWSKKYSTASVALAASFIQFPRNAAKIKSCLKAASRFGIAMDGIWVGSAGSGTMEVQRPNYTPHDLDTIQYAHDFASTCTSLFFQMVDGTTCGTPHKAKLHLSGFKEDQLKMSVGTCQETDWVSAVFTRSFDRPSPEPFHFDLVCSPTSSHPEGFGTLHVDFNSEDMWASASNNGTGPDSTAPGGEELLDHLLTHRDGLALKYRKLAGVLLAASIVQLIDSPWIEQHLGSESIFVPPPNNKRLQQWCPRVLCTLVQKKDTRLQSDNIAALGVLILELEAGRKANWAASDEHWMSGKRLNHLRLARILKSWEDLVSDEYRNVAMACLKFEKLIENFVHPDIGEEMNGVAVIYKCILEPLYLHIMKSFASLAPLFKGMFDPSRRSIAPINISTCIPTKWVLFDDDDFLSERNEGNSASSFLSGLEPFFQKIKALHKENISLAQHPTHEKIRIAVLDSGVDDTDPTIRPAIKFGRINTWRSKSFVGRPDEWRQDTYGHGTHVTQLLLKTAPAAEIYVGKICTGKTSNYGFMPGIAKAIDWAVNECDAHIISMSFGLENEKYLIGEALDNAIKAEKLIIAAASNNGGLSGRTRPARREDVICIHATDGKGNKSGTSPSPLANRDNFATLGVAVPLRLKGSDVLKSGTSFAVPIAVGFAASVLEFAKYKCTNPEPRKLKILHRNQGMQAIFRKMAESRDGYDFIHPVRLWKGYDWEDARGEQQAAKAIDDIMEEF